MFDQYREALDRAQAEVFERHSVIDERILLREALISGRADVQLEELRKEVEARVAKGDLIRRGQQIVSRETLAMEREYLNWVLTYKRGHSDLGKVSNLDPELTQEQREAVCTILFNRDQVIIFQGKAGTGKTRTLQEIIKGIEKGGKDVFACAPSSGATEVLRKELTLKADTLQQLLVNEGLQQRIRNKVIIVDEAGLISTKQMRDLCRIARENNNRLVLTGDIGQHNSVQAGDALRALQTYGNVVTAQLTKIRRQRDPAFRKAVSLLADKKAYRAFEEFYRLGAVKEIPDPKVLMQMAVDDYVKTIGQKKSCLVISPVWSDIHRFTGEVRPRLKAAGVLAEGDKAVHDVPFIPMDGSIPAGCPQISRWVMSSLSTKTAPGLPRVNMSPLRNGVGKRSWCGMNRDGGSPLLPRKWRVSMSACRGRCRCPSENGCSSAPT